MTAIQTVLEIGSKQGKNADEWIPEKEWLLRSLNIGPNGKEVLEYWNLSPEIYRSSGIRSASGSRLEKCMEFALEKSAPDGDLEGKELGSQIQASENYLILPYYSNPQSGDERPVISSIKIRTTSSVKSSGSSKSSDQLDFGSNKEGIDFPFMFHESLKISRWTRNPLYVVQGELNAVAIRSIGRPAVGLPTSSKWTSNLSRKFLGGESIAILDSPWGPVIGDRALESIMQEQYEQNGKTEAVYMRELSKTETPLSLRRHRRLKSFLTDFERQYDI